MAPVKGPKASSSKPTPKASTKRKYPKRKTDHDSNSNTTPGVQKIKSALRQARRLLAKVSNTVPTLGMCDAQFTLFSIRVYFRIN